MTCLSIKLSHIEFSKKKSIKEKFYTLCSLGKGKLLKTCEKLKIHPFYGKGEKKMEKYVLSGIGDVMEIESPLGFCKGESSLLDSRRKTQELLDSMKTSRRKTLAALVEMSVRSSDATICSMGKSYASLTEFIAQTEDKLKEIETEIQTKIITAIKDSLTDSKTDEDESDTNESSQKEEDKKESKDE